MKYQIGEVVRFSEDASYYGAFRLGGCLATITDAKQYGNYGDGTLAPGPVYKTAITGDTWVHQDYLVPVNGGMKPAEESTSGSQSTYQLGEVIRFADTPSNREKRLHGKLATIIAVNHDYPETYQTAITACDEWFIAKAFEPVNGGMPKSKEESTVESLPVAVYQELERESQRRDKQQQRKLAGAIVSAMDAYLREVGDNRDFYSRCGEYMSMQDMYDAIVNEFDLTAQ